jgi:hypothetical protein
VWKIRYSSLILVWYAIIVLAFSLSLPSLVTFLQSFIHLLHACIRPIMPVSDFRLIFFFFFFFFFLSCFTYLCLRAIISPLSFRLTFRCFFFLLVSLFAFIRASPFSFAPSSLFFFCFFDFFFSLAVLTTLSFSHKCMSHTEIHPSISNKCFSSIC